MSKPNVHIVPRDGQWAVLREGAQRDSSHHSMQSEAISAGRATAQREHVELLVHGRDGQIRDRDSHGHDPFPPRG
jgi:hypothetical protein